MPQTYQVGMMWGASELTGSATFGLRKKSFKAHQPLKTMFKNKSPAATIFSHSQLDSDNASIVNTSVASLSTPNYLLVPNTDEENRLLIKQTIFSKEERVLYYASRKRSTFG
ncbi:hypothetical protein TNIN_277901 [Trichonephila inaurata madagascariensis]|uniref:Uncharacterized protein n=1 Tax=Trichonephila inaurata madagascariensis TaxID=2747483 RepID=A0A8X6XLM2_9ARAC|nr:hypothetical protein TNIN_277901 [Trichonephila inaurata madagascariensis]